MTDLISRQAANDALDRTCNLVCKYSKKQRYSMCGACPLGSAFDALTEVPTIDPVKHGRWVSDGFTWRCSECGKTYWGRLAQPWNYCPNCGAKVEEKK